MLGSSKVANSLDGVLTSALDIDADDALILIARVAGAAGLAGLAAVGTA